MKAKYEEIIDNTKYRIVYESYLYKLVKSKIRFVEQSKSFTFFATRLLILCVQKLKTYKMLIRDRQVLVIETQYKSFISRFKTLAKHLAYYMKNKILTRFIEEHNVSEDEIQEILKSVKNPDPIMKYIDLSDLMDPQAQEQFEEKHNPTESETLQLKEIADTDPTPKRKVVKKLPEKLQEDLAERRQDTKEFDEKQLDKHISQVIKEFSKRFAKDAEVVHTLKQIISIAKLVQNGDLEEIYNNISEFLRQKTIVIEKPKALTTLQVHKVFDIINRLLYAVFNIMKEIYFSVSEIALLGMIDKKRLQYMSSILSLIENYTYPQDSEIYEVSET